MKASRTDHFGMPIIALKGALNTTTRDQLMGLLRTALTASHSSIVVDLSEITAMDTTAAHCLLNAQRELERQNRRLRLLDPSPHAGASLRLAARNQAA